MRTEPRRHRSGSPARPARRRGALLVYALISAVALTGCGPGASDPAAVATWADSVCRATASLDRSLRDLGSDLSAGLATAQTTLEQAKEQARRRLDAVAADTQALDAAVGATPDEASRPAQEQLRTDEARAAQAVQELQQAATGIAAADTTPELATQSTITAATWTAATQDVERLLDTLRQLAANGSHEVRTAFRQAPSCAQLPARPASAR